VAFPLGRVQLREGIREWSLQVVSTEQYYGVHMHSACDGLNTHPTVAHSPRLASSYRRVSEWQQPSATLPIPGDVLTPALGRGLISKFTSVVYEVHL
jgi:hypothetical protein